MICHSLGKKSWGIIDLQCCNYYHLLSDFSSTFQFIHDNISSQFSRMLIMPNLVSIIGMDFMQSASSTSIWIQAMILMREESLGHSFQNKSSFKSRKEKGLIYHMKYDEIWREDTRDLLKQNPNTLWRGFIGLVISQYFGLHITKYLVQLMSMCRKQFSHYCWEQALWG